MGTTHHICTSIPGLLRQSNKVLARLFQMDPDQIRTELNERLARGEKYIPSEGCEGFDPVKGCPGHPIEEENIKMTYEIPAIIRDEQNLLH